MQENNKRLAGTSLKTLFRANPSRGDQFARRFGPLFADFSRVHIDEPALNAGLSWVEASQLQEAAASMRGGEVVNPSEGRAALHTALRAPRSAMPASVAEEVAAARDRMLIEAEQLFRGEKTTSSGVQVSDLIALGIGGSRLGPELVAAALPSAGRTRVHFLSNPDPESLRALTQSLDPAATAVCITSKSFTTRETRSLASSVLRWRGDSDAPVFAVTANPEEAKAIGIEASDILPMWDFIGGRYSVWSCAGFPAAVSCGASEFQALLDGAHRLDQHFFESNPDQNLPIILGLLDVWQRSFEGHPGIALVPYADRLELLPAWLQQLWMESNGKHIQKDGTEVTLETEGIVFGGTGADVQHSFFQALHQGSQILPVEFVGVVGQGSEHDLLLANLIGQAEALLHGEDQADSPQRRFPGNRPSIVLLLDELDAHSLGMLLALYEHRAFVQAHLWGINPFDQFGVELGKKLAAQVEPALADQEEPALPPSASSLIRHIRKVRQGDE